MIFAHSWCPMRSLSYDLSCNILENFKVIFYLVLGSCSNLVGKWQVSPLIGRCAGNRDSFFWSFDSVLKFSISTISYRWIIKFILDLKHKILPMYKHLTGELSLFSKFVLMFDKSNFVTSNGWSEFS